MAKSSAARYAIMYIYAICIVYTYNRYKRKTKIYNTVILTEDTLICGSYLM